MFVMLLLACLLFFNAFGMDNLIKISEKVREIELKRSEIEKINHAVKRKRNFKPFFEYLSDRCDKDGRALCYCGKRIKIMAYHNGAYKLHKQNVIRHVLRADHWQIGNYKSNQPINYFQIKAEIFNFSVENYQELVPAAMGLIALGYKTDDKKLFCDGIE